MANNRSPLPWMLVMLVSLWATGCRLMNHEASRPLLGGVDVRGEHAGEGAGQPSSGPRIVYVADFQLDSQQFQGDQGVRGMMPERMQERGLLGNMGQRLPHPFATDDPAEKARQLVDAMAKALVDGFVAKGMPAQRLVSTSGSLPAEGWLVQGMFTEVDEGNRFKRAVIGFGQGASSMEIQVGVSDLAANQPRQPFILFGTVKDPSKLPGAVVTVNPYVAAAKFVMEKNASEKDVNKSAGEIVDEILKYEDKFKEEAAARSGR